MKSSYLLSLAVTLSGCAHTLVAPAEIKPEVVTVLETCFDSDPTPVESSLNMTQARWIELGLEQKVALALRELEIRRAYEAGLENQIKACRQKQAAKAGQKPTAPTPDK